MACSHSKRLRVGVCIDDDDAHFLALKELLTFNFLHPSTSLSSSFRFFFLFVLYPHIFVYVWINYITRKSTSSTRSFIPLYNQSESFSLTHAYTAYSLQFKPKSSFFCYGCKRCILASNKLNLQTRTHTHIHS